MTRLIRRTLRRCGFDLAFRPMLCPEEIKTISIDPQWRAKVTVRRTLVFLSLPDEGDLRDLVPVDSAGDADSSIHESPDAVDIGRRPIASGTCIYWAPRERLVPYALYHHQRSWSSPAEDARDVLYTEFSCWSRTGIMAVEIVAPVAFQAAVAFKVPRWRRLGSEHRMMKYALEQMETSRSRPILRDARQRVEWKVAAPRIGDRFVCIAFTAEGLAEWQRRLQDSSLRGRLRRVFRLGRGGHDAGSDGSILLPRT